MTSDELSKLTGYSPNQRVRTYRWLREKGIPFEINRLGEPVVLRSAVERKSSEDVGPDLSWLDEKPTKRR